MKFGPVTNLNKRKKTMPKKFDDDVMSANCDMIIIFQSYGHFAAMRKPDSGRMVCKTYISINNSLSSRKN